MIVDIQTRRLRTIGQLRAFVEGNEAVDFQPRDRDEAYGFVRDTPERFGYRRLGKRDKGVVLRFLVAATGISLKQTERLVRQWRETGAVRDRRGGGRGRPFARKYAAADIRLLAEVDEAFGQMSGLATREVPRRQFACQKPFAGFGLRSNPACRETKLRHISMIYGVKMVASDRLSGPSRQDFG